MTKDLSSRLPDWVQPGAVFEYRGGTEKILAIGDRSVSTVGAESFITWDLSGFRLALTIGDISPSKRTHAVRTKKSATTVLQPRLNEQAAEEFARLHASFLDNTPLQTRMMGWARTVATGESAEPWVHMLALKLIHLGAKSLGFDPRIIANDRRGRPSALRHAAIDAFALITRLVKFLDGGDPISRADWFKVRSLWERGMIVVGLMPAPKCPNRGRPVTHDSEARWILGSKRLATANETPKSRSELIRGLAANRVLTRRRVAAAWLGEPYETIRVEDDDSQVREEFLLIESRFHRHLRDLKRRSM